jgi:hypothetical protein
LGLNPETLTWWQMVQNDLKWAWPFLLLVLFVVVAVFGGRNLLSKEVSNKDSSAVGEEWVRQRRRRRR